MLMNSNTIRITLGIVGTLVALAWFIESATLGRGFISTYLAPFAFGPLLIAALMHINEKRRSGS